MSSSQVDQAKRIRRRDEGGEDETLCFLYEISLRQSDSRI